MPPEEIDDAVCSNLKKLTHSSMSSTAYLLACQRRLFQTLIMEVLHLYQVLPSKNIT